MEILEIDVKYLKILKVIYQQTYSQYYIKWKQAENISSNIRNETKMGNLTAFIQYSAQSLSYSNKTRERHRRHTNRKDRSQTLPTFRKCNFTL